MWDPKKAIEKLELCRVAGSSQIVTVGILEDVIQAGQTDDTESEKIWNQFKYLEQRIARLEDMCLFKPITDEKLFQCPECKVKSSFPTAHETSCSRRGMINDKPIAKGNECEHDFNQTGLGPKCSKCGEYLLNKYWNKPDTISIPRSVAEEWFGFWGGWQQRIEKESPQTRMVKAIKQALK